MMLRLMYGVLTHQGSGTLGFPVSLLLASYVLKHVTYFLSTPQYLNIEVGS